MNPKNGFEYRIKIVIAGAVAAGKSSILRALCNERFTSEHITTIGVDYGTITLKTNDNKKERRQYKFCLWDTSGHKSFMPITKSYFGHSTACILVFDLTDMNSFTESIEWYEYYVSMCPGNTVILVGTKVDKINKSEIKQENAKLTYGFIGEDKIKDFINDDIPYLEISSFTKQNITELKDLIINDVNTKIVNGQLVPNTTIGLTMHKLENNEPSPYKYNPTGKKQKESVGCCTLL
jgi:small GTP-binding protein